MSEEESGESFKILVEDEAKSDDGAFLTYKNVNYIVKKKSKCRGKVLDEKQVLFSLSGIMKPGLNAIMGPSGGGKSSLLDVLAMRKDPAGLSGEVLLNGNPLPRNFKRISGYVTQKDIITGTLTVRENLMFCANLRLPTSINPKDKVELVKKTISDLGLDSCADTKVGNDIIRGISGGEKKRACIAIELVTSPPVLFLDEPTTGLDASTANQAMRLLKRLANQGRTIVFSIHQPRYSIFKLFDSLTLLAKGRRVFHGPLSEALPYFEEIGYTCAEHNNPADFFLDVVNGDADLGESSKDTVKVIKEQDLEDSSTVLAIELNKKFELTDLYKTTKKEVQEASVSRSGDWHSDVSPYATNSLHQFRFLFRRAFFNVIRNPAAFSILFINVFVGLVFGVLFFQIEDSLTTGTQNRFGVLFFMVTNTIFSAMTSLEVFVAEKDLFTHQYASGYYRASPYFLAKLLADTLPLRTFGPFLFASVTYWMTGLKPEFGAFVQFFLLVLSVGYSAQALVLFFGSICPDRVMAQSLLSLVFILSILFAGLLLKVDSIMGWLGWLQYFSIAKYGYTALAVNEFSGQVFRDCKSKGATSASSSCGNTVIVDGKTCTEVSGECFLYTQLGLGDGKSPVEGIIWSYFAILIGVSGVLFFFTYLRLAATKTTT